MRLPPKDHEKHPVVVELRDEKEGGRTGAFVRPITVDESDFLMRTAGLVRSVLPCHYPLDVETHLMYSLLYRVYSKGIVFAANRLSTGITSATSDYIAHSKPTREPVVFSDRISVGCTRFPCRPSWSRARPLG